MFRFILIMWLIIAGPLPVSAQNCAFFCDEEFWYTLDAQSTADLIAAGADVEEQGPRGWVPLTIAAALGDAEMSRVLLEAGADVHSQVRNGLTQLHAAGMIMPFMRDVQIPAATEAEYLENMRVLLEYGADVNGRGPANATPLFVATGFGTPAVIELLIDVGADLEARPDLGWTPLHNAASAMGMPGTVAPLLAAGADVNESDHLMGQHRFISRPTARKLMWLRY